MNVVVAQDKHGYVKLNRIMNPQSGQGGSWGISTDASWQNQDGWGGTDKPAEVDGSSNKIRAA